MELVVEKRVYHRFNSNKYNLYNIPEDEIIQESDDRFRNAIRHEYDKDREYGYKHLTDLSSGLDSRMAMWIEKKWGMLL